MGVWNLFGLTVEVLFRCVEGWTKERRPIPFLVTLLLLLFLSVVGMELSYLSFPLALSRNNSVASLSERPRRFN